jgi:hypothetical protein
VSAGLCLRHGQGLVFLVLVPCFLHLYLLACSRVVVLQHHQKRNAVAVAGWHLTPAVGVYGVFCFNCAFPAAQCFLSRQPYARVSSRSCTGPLVVLMSFKKPLGQLCTAPCRLVRAYVCPSTCHIAKRCSYRSVHAWQQSADETSAHLQATRICFEPSTTAISLASVCVCCLAVCLFVAGL